jgi:hypothetical protein
MSQLCRVFGITIRTDWELPYCESTGGAPAVEIIQASNDEMQRAAAEAASLPSPPAWYRVASLHDGSTFARFPSLFDFLISGDGRRVSAHLRDASEFETFQIYLLTHAISHAMFELGIEHLHATCVYINKTAVAFAGESGHGKSTLAATFLRSGYPLMTDDMLVLDSTPAVVEVIPGLPHIKLLPETVHALLGKHVQGKPMNPLTEKMVIPLKQDQFHCTHAPLHSLYVLAPPSVRAGPVRITPLSKQEAFVELCKAGFSSFMLKPERLKRQFAFASELAKKLPVKLLCFENGMDHLDAVRDAVLLDIG